MYLCFFNCFYFLQKCPPFREDYKDALLCTLYWSGPGINNSSRFTIFCFIRNNFLLSKEGDTVKETMSMFVLESHCPENNNYE